MSPIRLNDTFRSQLELAQNSHASVKITKQPLKTDLVNTQFLTSLNLDNSLTHQQIVREVSNDAKALPRTKSDTRITID